MLQCTGHSTKMLITWHNHADQIKSAHCWLLHDAGRWRDMLIESTNAQGVATVTVSTEAPYVSNYIPLWAGLLDDEPEEALAVVQSFYRSGVVVVNEMKLCGQHERMPCLAFAGLPLLIALTSKLKSALL